MLFVVIISTIILYYTLQLFNLNQYVIDGYVSVCAVTMFGKWLEDVKTYISTRRKH